MAPQDQRPEQQKSSQQPQIGFVYFNGFELGTTLSDVGVVLMIDGQPQVKLSASFTTAKTLAQQLNRAIEAFEKSTNNTLLTMSDIEAAYSTGATKR